MKLAEAIEILEEFNQWRQGKIMHPAYSVKITKALEIAIHLLKELK